MAVEFSMNSEYFGKTWAQDRVPTYFRVNGGAVRENTTFLTAAELTEKFDPPPLGPSDSHVQIAVSQDGEMWHEITSDLDTLPNVQVRKVRIWGVDFPNVPETWGAHKYAELADVLDTYAPDEESTFRFMAALVEHHVWDLDEAQDEFPERYEGQFGSLTKFAEDQLVATEIPEGYTLVPDEVYWDQYYSLIVTITRDRFVYRVT